MRLPGGGAAGSGGWEIATAACWACKMRSMASVAASEDVTGGRGCAVGKAGRSREGRNVLLTGTVPNRLEAAVEGWL